MQPSTCATNVDDATGRISGSLVISKLTNLGTAPRVDCDAVRGSGATENGVYDIYPSSSSTGVNVYCELQGTYAWTIILSRNSISTHYNFTRPWQDYKNGFGDPLGEYWLGNENLHAVTGGEKQYMLRVDATRLTGESGTGEWDVFIVDTESNNYRVTITGYNSVSSTLGDDLTYNSGLFFSTIDVDNSGGCVTQRGGGGWWYSGCSWAHPTAPHGNTDGSSSVLSWYYFTPTTSGWVGLKQLKMMIRPK